MTTDPTTPIDPIVDEVLDEQIEDENGDVWFDLGGKR